MRILFWTPLYWPDVGGIEVLSMQLLPELKQRGHQFTVVTSHGAQRMPDVSELDGIPVHRFSFWQALSNRNLPEIMAIQRRLEALKAEFKPDLVHLNFPGHIAYFHLKSQTRSPRPTLLTVHTDFSFARPGADTVFGQCLSTSDWVSSVSVATLRDVLAFEPELKSRSSVILNGIRFPENGPTPLPFAPPQILCMGRLISEKGFDVAIKAFALVQAAHPNARLVIAGDGPLRGELESLARDLGVQDGVNFCGRVGREAIFDLINQSTLVVVPSRYKEPFALVAVEAAQMARPVVAARRGGLVETVADGRSGLLVESENVPAFAAAIESLIQQPEWAESLGQFGRERARTMFGLENCATAYDELYRRLGGSIQ